VDGGDERFVRFLELLAERHRMPVLMRIRREFEELYAEERKLLPVKITSAVELDEQTVKRIGKRIEEETGRTIELATTVDPDVIGGLSMQVGNVIMDATIRARLDRLRKEVAKAA
jgi:ATP synthase F1 delta subunit